MTELLSRLFVKNYNDTQNPMVRKAYGSLSSIVGIVSNFILSILKIVVGVTFSSVAIIADGLNNLSDAGNSLITLISFKLSAKPADRKHPFGHARIEYIASMIVSFLILVVGFEMLSSSVEVLLGVSENSVSDFSTVSLILIGASVLVKLWLGLFNRKIGNKISSDVIKATSLDSLLDALSTTAVLISSIIVKFTGFVQLDAIVGIAVSVLIFVAGIKILNETKNSLLGEAPVDHLVNSIKEIVEGYSEVVGIHDLMLHNYGPNKYIASFHAEVDGSDDIFALHDAIDNLEKQIQTELDIQCTVHMDPIVTNDETINELKSFVIDVINTEVDQRISIHDFRAVIGATHTNLIFDVVLPFESKTDPEKLSEEISKKINDKRNWCYCVITVDRG